MARTIFREVYLYQPKYINKAFRLAREFGGVVGKEFTLKLKY